MDYVVKIIGERNWKHMGKKRDTVWGFMMEMMTIINKEKSFLTLRKEIGIYIYTYIHIYAYFQHML
jgi:hypothetical protein